MKETETAWVNMGDLAQLKNKKSIWKFTIGP